MASKTYKFKEEGCNRENFKIKDNYMVVFRHIRIKMWPIIVENCKTALCFRNKITDFRDYHFNKKA